MNITNLVLGAYLTLVGLAQLGVLSASDTLLGLLALVAGIAILVVGVGPYVRSRG